VGARVALCNQLLAQLGVCFPGAVGLFGDLHSGVAGAFLRRYPTAARAASLTEASLAAFLRRILSRHERQGTNRLVGEDAVAAELELTGTNTGPMMMAGKNPANRQERCRQGRLLRSRRGRQGHLNSYPDIAGMMMQLRFMPEM